MCRPAGCPSPALPPHFQLLFTRGGGSLLPSLAISCYSRARRSRWGLQHGSNSRGRRGGGGSACEGGVFHQPAHPELQGLVSNTRPPLLSIKLARFIVLPAISYREDAAAAEEEESSTNQRTQSLKGCSSSAEKFYPIHSPLKKRKSQHELIDPRLLSLKYKFRKRLSRQDDESATTESLGCDGVFINKNCSTDMVSIPEELDPCENTLSLFGGCIEVDSKNGIEIQSMTKMFEAWASGSSSSSNIFSSDASSSRSTGTKDTDSWIMHDDECYPPGLVLQPHDNDLDRMHDLLEQYGDLMNGELACGDVHGSASHTMDEKLYSNGVDDFQILPTGQTTSHGEKKLTIDQEFEQYFSRLML